MTQSNLTFTESQPIPEGYKKTEVGLIPQDWSVQKFGKLFEPSITRIKLKSDDSVAFVGMQDVSESAQLITQKVVKFHEVRSGFTFFGKGDVLVAKITPCFENGKGCITDNLITNIGYGSTEFHVLRANENSVSKFIYYWTVNSTFRKKLELDMVGSAGHRRVPLSSIQNYLIPLPATHAEQQKIATALSDTDNLISELEKFIEKKQAIKTATMQQLLTGKTRLPEFSLRKDGTPKAYKDSELGQIPEDWDIKTYGEIFKFLSTANNARDDLTEEGDYSYIHYGDIHTKFNECIDCEKVSFPQIDKEKVSSVFVKSGDLVMADASEDYAGIGKSIEMINVNIKIVAGLHTFLLRDEKQYYVDGFKAYLHLIPKVKKSMDRLATGLKVYSLSKTVLKTILLPVPLKEEQSAIVAFFNDMNLDIDISEQKLEKLKLIKQGMMQELLTGKTRLV